MPVVESVLKKVIEAKIRSEFNLGPDTPKGVETLKLASIITAAVLEVIKQNDVQVDPNTGKGKWA